MFLALPIQKISKIVFEILHSRYNISQIKRCNIHFLHSSLFSFLSSAPCTFCGFLIFLSLPLLLLAHLAYPFSNFTLCSPYPSTLLHPFSSLPTINVSFFLPTHLTVLYHFSGLPTLFIPSPPYQATLLYLFCSNNSHFSLPLLLLTHLR